MMSAEITPLAIDFPRWAPDQVPDRDEIAASLYQPFTLNLNPNFAKAQGRSAAWLRNLKLLEGKRLHRAIDARMAGMSSGFYPTTGLDQLTLATDYLGWAFALDDVGDETDVGLRPQRLMELFDKFEEIFDGAVPSSKAIRLEVGLHDVLQRLSRFASSDQMRAFH